MPLVITCTCELKGQIECILEAHVKGLLKLGMIVNTKKTEIVLFNKPSAWADYSTASLVIKVMQNEQPKHLFRLLTMSAFQEQRRSGRMKYFDDTNTKVGWNSLRNRLTDLFNTNDFDFYPFISPDRLRINLKRLLWCVAIFSLLFSFDKCLDIMDHPSMKEAAEKP